MGVLELRDEGELQFEVPKTKLFLKRLKGDILLGVSSAFTFNESELVRDSRPFFGLLIGDRVVITKELMDNGGS